MTLVVDSVVAFIEFRTELWAGGGFANDYGQNELAKFQSLDDVSECFSLVHSH